MNAVEHAREVVDALAVILNGRVTLSVTSEDDSMEIAMTFESMPPVIEDVILEYIKKAFSLTRDELQQLLYSAKIPQ